MPFCCLLSQKTMRFKWKCYQRWPKRATRFGKQSPKWHEFTKNYPNPPKMGLNNTGMIQAAARRSVLIIAHIPTALLEGCESYQSYLCIVCKIRSDNIGMIQVAAGTWCSLYYLDLTIPTQKFNRLSFFNRFSFVDIGKMLLWISIFV